MGVRNETETWNYGQFLGFALDYGCQDHKVVRCRTADDNDKHH